MPGTAPASRIHPLCYEHHCEMKLRESPSSENGADYACDEPDCLVHYSRSDGYFLNTQDQLLIKRAPIPPHQYCWGCLWPSATSPTAPGRIIDSTISAFTTGPGTLPSPSPFFIR